MKKSAKKKDYSLIQLFVISFFGMLLVFTVLIKSFSPSVDVSIGDYKQEPEIEEKTINDNNAISVIYSNEERLHDVKILLINQDDNISVDVFVGYEKNYPMFIKSYYIDAIINRKIFRYSPLKIYEKDDKKYTLLNFETAEKQKILCLYNDKNPVIKEYSFNNYSIDKALSFVEKTLWQ